MQPPPGPWEMTFWYFSAALKVGLLGRIFQLRRLGEYPAISTFLALQLIRTLWLLQYSIGTNEYSFSWAFTEPLLILSRVLVVFELYEKILASYRGLSFLSRSTMTMVLAASVALSAISHSGEFHSNGDISRLIKAVKLFETTTYTAMLLFLLALAAFMLWFPMPVRKNVLVHCCAFASYFVVSSAAVYLRMLNVAEWGRLSSTWRLAAADFIMLAWIVLLTQRGEQTSGAISFHISASSQERLLGQLDALNRALEAKRRHPPKE